jgi:SAM-dependent methyltransferase
MGSSSRLCIHADAHGLPFKSGFFDKVFSQDGDAWLHPTKRVLMGEIHRVTARNGLFVYQSYADSKAMPKAALTKTKALLRKCGFAQTAVVHTEDVEEMFEAAGFRVESIASLHEVYAADNARMLESLRKIEPRLLKSYPPNDVRALADLLEWEGDLFRNRWWTGVLAVARKIA